MTEAVAMEREAAPGTRRQKVCVVNVGPNWGQYGEREIIERAGGEIVMVQSRDQKEIIEACRDAVAIYGGFMRFDREFFDALQCCKIIARSSIGMDVVDVEAATEKGIILSNLPDTFHKEVADHTMALLLAFVRGIVPMANAVRQGAWGQPSLWRSMVGTIPRIEGRTLGLLGFGNIAREVARRAAGFELHVIAHDPYVQPAVFERYGVKPVSFAALLQDSDFLSLHVPLLPETRHMISDAEFSLMKPTAIIINTCRGPVIDEAALIRALEQKRIAGAALDVTETEPIPQDSPLLKMPNVIITPHMASASDVSSRERSIRPAQEIAAVLAGHLPRVVYNKAVLEKVTLKP